MNGLVTRTRLEAGFTLVEIILAIGLATGLLLVAMTFYQQATQMRHQLLVEAERTSAMRLVLDRLASDLRAAQPKASPGNEFSGGSNWMSFVKEAFTSLPPGAPAGTPEPTDLVRISLTALYGTNETGMAVSGLDRSETPLGTAAVSLPVGASSDSVVTNSDVMSLESVDQTNLAGIGDSTNTMAEVFADMIRFVRFRYWDGAAWQPGWTNLAPPPGVELVLSTQADASDADPDALPNDALRRVVVVPGGLRRGGSETNDAGASTNADSSEVPE